MAQLSVKEVLKPFNKGEMVGKERPYANQEDRK